MLNPICAPPPRYLCTKEAARFLSLSARTLEKHRTYGTDSELKTSTSDPRRGPAPARRRKTTADCEQNVDTSRD